MTTPTLSRRSALFAGAALPLAAPALLSARPALAAAPQQGAGHAPFHRVKLGAFEVTTILAGTRAGDKPQETFGMNVPAEEFAAVSAANFIPADRTFNFFTPVVVNTGAELVLFDTGLDATATTAALSGAGITPDQIDIVIITHMHGDHIGGLSGEDGSPTYTNARYVTGATEHNTWSAAGNETFDAKVKPLNEKFSFLDDGGAVVSGITAMAAPGHTPGHFTYMLESGNARMAILADTTNHYVWSLAHPDWEVRFDQDKAQAAATRRQILGMLATDRIPFAGYHMPFPAIGYVEANGDGFRYVPASYQLML
ncbi:MBL fold metallo-hydrolase [Rhodobacteraceae bacterium HSP-20]|uniref:MBL fold metallo-hydrolase n=1 Tax=Paragemmobacter amnigenus TaxID=2852097 RepID=A0ABS6J1B9_9RHOB|nr:MBL fold metallo-hydrolase [Rhodobacter amnigenus]MBU9697551.1 MBL fold metallo-hydrolase [Rhodobacter amnigenus]MBV4388778.1 MBL fold metallo-hydrolase [Rhodobacter amnigenus]